MITAGTDGACAGNPGPAGWAWVVDDTRWQSGSLGHATNNAAELEAILRALVAVPLNVDLTVLSDSDYAIKAVTVWHKAWRRNGWRTRNGGPVANQPRIEAITALVQARTGVTRFEWVRGHAGHPLNEAADKLAVRARTASPRQVTLNGPAWAAAGGPAVALEG